MLACSDAALVIKYALEDAVWYLPHVLKGDKWKGVISERGANTWCHFSVDAYLPYNLAKLAE